DLITTSPYKHWNPVALQSYLCDEDQRLVSQIYLSQTEKEDKLIWSHTRDGNYTNAWIGGYSDMIFEGDSEILVTTINDHLTNYVFKKKKKKKKDHLTNSTIQNLLEEINSLKNKLSTTTFTFVKRNGNQAAHEIVRHGPANSIFENCKVYPPKWLTPTLYSDIMLSY
ncbi:hypothetical protein HID58_002562, partial [Brassica napus]